MKNGLLLLMLLAHTAFAAADPFAAGIQSYHEGEIAEAAQLFRAEARRHPASGTLLNLGNAEWRLGRVGEAVLAWEQSVWLDPFNDASRNNLQFARETVQLESPELTWYEIASSWMPVEWWAWITGLSLWAAVGALVLPGVFRWRRSTWHQTVAAFSLGLFLLCVPAHLGTTTRANIGIVLKSDTPLRLTPTSHADAITRLAAGEPVRQSYRRGNYIFVRTHRAAGWLLQSEAGFVARTPLLEIANGHL